MGLLPTRWPLKEQHERWCAVIGGYSLQDEGTCCNSVTLLVLSEWKTYSEHLVAGGTCTVVKSFNRIEPDSNRSGDIDLD